MGAGRNPERQTIEVGCKRCGWKQHVGPGEPLPYHVCKAAAPRPDLPRFEEWAEGGWRCKVCKQIVTPPHICPGFPP